MIETARARQQTVPVPNRGFPWLRTGLWVALLFLSTALLVHGVAAVLHIHAQLARSVRTVGRVVAIEPNPDGETDVCVFAFEVDGTTRTFRNGWGSNPPACRVGEPVEIAYVPEAPDTYVRLAFFETHTWKILFAILPGLCGALFALGGLFGGWLLRKHHPHLYRDAPA